MKLSRTLFAFAVLAVCASLRAGTLYWYVDSSGDGSEAFKSVYEAAKAKVEDGKLFIGAYQDNNLLGKFELTLSDGVISTVGLGDESSSPLVGDATSSAFRWEIMAEATSYFTSGTVTYDQLLAASALASSPLYNHKAYNVASAGLSWSPAPVPEPTSGLLLLVGGALLALRRRRREEV